MRFILDSEKYHKTLIVPVQMCTAIKVFHQKATEFLQKHVGSSYDSIENLAFAYRYWKDASTPKKRSLYARVGTRDIADRLENWQHFAGAKTVEVLLFIYNTPPEQEQIFLDEIMQELKLQELLPKQQKTVRNYDEIDAWYKKRCNKYSWLEQALKTISEDKK